VMLDMATHTSEYNELIEVTRGVLKAKNKWTLHFWQRLLMSKNLARKLGQVGLAKEPWSKEHLVQTGSIHIYMYITLHT
jgi:hypothetical protein